MKTIVIETTIEELKNIIMKYKEIRKDNDVRIVDFPISDVTGKLVEIRIMGLDSLEWENRRKSLWRI